MASTDRILRTLALAIRERRKALGASATQEEIAHRARVSVRHFQKLEAGTINPRLDTLVSVARALRTNVQSLLDAADEFAGQRRPK